MNTSESPPAVAPIVEPFDNIAIPPPSSAPVIIDPNNPPWGALAAIGAWIVSIILLAFVPIIAAIPYLVYRASTGANASAESLMADKTFKLFLVLGVIPAHLLTLGVIWFLVTRAGRYPFWKTLGWEWPSNFGPWKSLLVAVGLLAIGVLITYLIGGKPTELDELINSSYLVRLATAFLAAATAPLVEEVVYRGVLYSALQRTIGVIGAVFIVTLLFAGVHVYQYRTNIGVILVITLLSFTLTAVRAYSGRLLPSFLIHFVFNGIQSVYLVVQPFLEKPQQIPAKPAPAADLITIVLRYFA